MNVKNLIVLIIRILRLERVNHSVRPPTVRLKDRTMYKYARYSHPIAVSS